jgi:Protein of unknown function (DUF3987)
LTGRCPLSRSFEGDADGLSARFLFAWPPEAPYRPLTDAVAEIEPEFENALTKLINLAEFEEGNLIVRHVTLAPDAVAAFEEFRQLVHRKKDGIDGREREWIFVIIRVWSIRTRLGICQGTLVRFALENGRQ